MATPDDCPDDVVETLLAAGPPQPADGLRAGLLSQTLGVIRRRRRLKRCAWGASLLGCYLAGIITAAIGRPGGQGIVRTSYPQDSQVSQASEDSGKDANSTPSVPARPPQPEPSIPDVREVAAAKPTDYERWRRTGDYYLRESGDISRAVRDYARALEHASDQEQAISPAEDNWLLMALKDARAKEREHVQSQQN
jgi:hypothetical protein